MKVLLVGKESSRFVPREILVELGVPAANIVETNDLGEAAALALKVQPDLAICGYVLDSEEHARGSLNGLNIATCIKSSVPHCTVVLSSTIKPDHIDMFLECKQIDHFFDKSQGIHELKPFLANLMNSKLSNQS